MKICQVKKWVYAYVNMFIPNIRICQTTWQQQYVHLIILLSHTYIKGNRQKANACTSNISPTVQSRHFDVALLVPGTWLAFSSSYWFALKLKKMYSINHADKILGILTPLPPSWSLLLNKGRFPIELKTEIRYLIKCGYHNLMR